MKHNLATTSTEIPADFTSTHIALLNEFQEQAVAMFRKPNAKPSEISTSLSILIRVERQFYRLSNRRLPSSRTKQTRTEPSPISVFEPTPESAVTQPAPAKSQSQTASKPTENPPESANTQPVPHVDTAASTNDPFAPFRYLETRCYDPKIDGISVQNKA